MEVYNCKQGVRNIESFDLRYYNYWFNISGWDDTNNIVVDVKSQNGSIWLDIIYDTTTTRGDQSVLKLKGSMKLCNGIIPKVKGIPVTSSEYLRRTYLIWKGPSRAPIQIRETTNGGIPIAGVTEAEVTSQEEILSFLLCVEEVMIMVEKYYEQNSSWWDALKRRVRNLHAQQLSKALMEPKDDFRDLAASVARTFIRVETHSNVNTFSL
nr:kinesin-like protein KIN-4C [Tanacetum cinerariifolium]